MMNAFPVVLSLGPEYAGRLWGIAITSCRAEAIKGARPPLPVKGTNAYILASNKSSFCHMHGVEAAVEIHRVSGTESIFRGKFNSCTDNKV